MTIIVPPSFEMLCNIDLLGMFTPYTVDIISEQVNDFFKHGTIKN